MGILERVFDWIAGVESSKAQTPQQNKAAYRRFKNTVELRQHVIVTQENDKYLVYTHDFLNVGAIPSEEEKANGERYTSKNHAIAGARHLLRYLHSTQEHPALVF